MFKASPPRFSMSSNGSGPTVRGVSAFLLVAAVMAGLVTLALSLPHTGYRFVTEANQLQVVHPITLEQEAVSALETIDGERLPLPGWLTVEEPDFLETYEAYNGLMALQDPLTGAWASGAASLILADGERLPLTPVQRELADLPVLFWLQLAFGFTALAIALSIWVFRPDAEEARLILLTAIGFSAGVWAASVYSTRELVMPETWFRTLSVVNHGGALLFDCAMMALLWVYPQPIRQRSITGIALLLWAGLWWLDTAQLLGTFFSGFYLWLLVIFMVACVFGGWQWRMSRQEPLSRLALRWMILSFLLGSGMFVAFQIVPLVMGVPVPIPQGVLAGAFLIVYLGLAVAVERFRLFDLERWWRLAWSWVLGGILVLLVDALLLWLLNAGTLTTLGLAVAVAGWLYFPLRQWLMTRLVHAGSQPGQLPARALRHLFDASSETALASVWPRVLQEAFHPMAMEPLARPCELTITEHGLRMEVPAIGGEGGLLLSYCERGARLFRREDLQSIHELLDIARHAQEAMAAHREGARLERERIKRDLHDDLGARLLSMVRTRDLHLIQQEARAGLTDLREMLVTLEEQPVALDLALLQSVGEMRERLSRSGIDFEDTLPTIPADVLIGARQHANLKRILRELTSNILKHAEATRVTMEARFEFDHLRVLVTDNGRFTAPDLDRGGRGHHIIRTRARELGGEVHWQTSSQGGCQVTLSLPLLAPADDDPAVTAAS